MFIQASSSDTEGYIWSCYALLQFPQGLPNALRLISNVSVLYAQDTKYVFLIKTHNLQCFPKLPALSLPCLCPKTPNKILEGKSKTFVKGFSFEPLAATIWNHTSFWQSEWLGRWPDIYKEIPEERFKQVITLAFAKYLLIYIWNKSKWVIPLW